jgi:hypothetical protein
VTWYGLESSFRRRIQAGDPAALRLYFERDICQAHAITFTYTADSRRWFARPKRRFISVPPPADLDAMAVCAHEAGHVVGPPCSGFGHQPNQSSRTHACLLCEQAAWIAAQAWLPFFDRAMHERLRVALGSYRLTTPAAPRVQGEVDRMMSHATFAARTVARQAGELRRAKLEAAYDDLRRVQLLLR